MNARPWRYLDAPDLTRLDLASVLVHEAIGTPYLVGSCLTRPDYRDVDVRVILGDARFDALFPQRINDPLRHVIEDAISRHYVTATGLRVDFQIQHMSNANHAYAVGGAGTVRHPLGLYSWRSAAGRSSGIDRDPLLDNPDSSISDRDSSRIRLRPISTFAHVRAHVGVQES